MAGSLIITLPQISWRIRQWKNFENWLRFDRVIATNVGAPFLRDSIVINHTLDCSWNYFKTSVKSSTVCACTWSELDWHQLLPVPCSNLKTTFCIVFGNIVSEYLHKILKKNCKNFSPCMMLTVDVWHVHDSIAVTWCKMNHFMTFYTVHVVSRSCVWLPQWIFANV